MSLYRFFIFCSGADLALLEECPSFERGKYASIGATVFFTGLFAFVSASYALSKVFNMEGIMGGVISVFFGLLWGLLIFNLDRYIVSSMKKRGDWYSELVMAIPRFIIAILISLVIAKPLEVKLFEKRINRQIDIIRTRAIANDDSTMNAIFNVNGLDEELKGIKASKNDEPKTEIYRDLKQKVSEVETEYNTLKNTHSPIINRKSSELAQTQSKLNINYRRRKEIKPKLDGTASFTLNEESALKEEFQKLIVERNKLIPRKDQLKNDIHVLESEIAEKKQELGELKVEMEKNKEEYYQQLKKEEEKIQIEYNKADSTSQSEFDSNKANIDISYDDNFITQVEALGVLTGDPEKNPTLWWANILITLLFVVIETAPVIVKLLTPKGPYDEKQEGKELLIRENLKDDLDTQVQINTEKNEKILEAEMASNNELLTNITEAQLEVAKMIVSDWKEEELEKVKQKNHNRSFEGSV